MSWWDDITAGASGPGITSGAGGYDTTIVTNVNGLSSARLALARAEALRAANEAVQRAIAIGQAAQAVEFARAAALPAWRDVAGSAEGYQTYEPGIFDQVASALNPVSTATTSAANSATQIAKTALSAAGATGIGALFGSAGTAILLGAGALILLVILKK